MGRSAARKAAARRAIAGSAAEVPATSKGCPSSVSVCTSIVISALASYSGAVSDIPQIVASGPPPARAGLHSTDVGPVVTISTIHDLDHEELATLVKEHLLAGHLIDRAGMPVVIGYGVDAMAAVAIDEWMGASPVYTKRTQRLLGFEGNTVEACFKAMQLELGAPPEFMDFRYTVIDD